MSEIEILRIVKERNNSYSHDGTDNTEPKRCMIATKNGRDLANIIPNSLHEATRWEVVGVFWTVKSGTKFDVCLLFCVLRNTVFLDASQGSQSFNPITRVKERWDE